MIYYMGSLVGYFYMCMFNQGLQMETSLDMFLYTASETIFMISMAMCYFYCFQTYAVEQSSINSANGEVIPVEIGEVGRYVLENMLKRTPFSDKLS